MELSILIVVLATFFATQLVFANNEKIKSMNTYKLLGCCLLMIGCSIILNMLLVIPSFLLIIVITVFATSLLLINYVEKTKKNHM